LRSRDPLQEPPILGAGFAEGLLEAGAVRHGGEWE